MKFRIVRDFDVELPERGTKNWQRLEDRIRSTETAEDAAIILATDEAVAVWVGWSVHWDGEIPEPFDSAIHGPYDPAKVVHKVIAGCVEVDVTVTPANPEG